MILLSAFLLLPLMQDQNVRAPELDGREWLNTDRPLSLETDLEGQVVLLDFWTYCCINCMHVLPDLARLEEAFRDEPFVVVGVHSAKFEQEGDAANIRQAILRYGIRHPVVVDEGMRIWQAYAVRAWPTLVMIDSEGYYRGSLSGELGNGKLELLKARIREMLEVGRVKGTLAEQPLRFQLEKGPLSMLRFPGKVRAHGTSLFVADSSGNRVLEVDAGDGRLLRTFGAREPGMQDGPGSEARFRNPQGMAVHGRHLYVADTDNHALRRIDMESGAVATVAGTGRQADWVPESGPGRKGRLNSPWALETEGDLVHVAMAGSHQLWSFDTASGAVRPLAGTGQENIVDGAADEALLAQPSGLALADGRLYFVDSEVSALRFVDLAQKQVHTVFGSGLFEFGDVDGSGAEVRLQHPLGVAAWKDKLLVADTYNNKVKLVDPAAGTSQTLLGTGEHEAEGDSLALFEPGGLDVQGDTLFVADTNHHRVLAVDLPTRHWRVLLGGASPAAGEAETKAPAKSAQGSSD